MRYIAGWNIPGYLPEITPSKFETFDEAKRHIITELKFQEENNVDEDGNFSESQAEIFCHKAEDVNLESGPFDTETMPDGYVYWVQEGDS